MIARLGAMPSDMSTTKLFAGNNYTIVVRTSGLLQPSEAVVQSLLVNPNNLGLFFENVTVTRPLFSQEYTVNFRSRKNTDLATVTRLININMPGYTVADFKAGVQLAPSILERVAPISTALSEPLSSIKWIALAGLGIVGLFYLAPFLSALAPRKR